MRTILCKLWLSISLLGGAFFVSAIYQWIKAKKRRGFLFILGVICIIIPGFTYLNSVKVINVVGLRVDSARQTLQSIGLLVELDFNNLDSEIVLRQNILPDSYVKKGTCIILYDEEYSPTDELLEIEHLEENNGSLFPAVNLAGLKAEDISAKYAESIGNIIISSNYKDNSSADLYRDVTFEVFEKAGLVYYKGEDSFACIDLLGEKIITSYLLVIDYDTLNVIATHYIEKGLIENPFKNLRAGKYFIVLLADNYKIYIWGPIQLKDHWTDALGTGDPTSISFALVPENEMFSDIKCIKIENTKSNLALFDRNYFINAVPISEKDNIKPVSLAPASIMPTYKDIIAADSSTGYEGMALPVYVEKNTYEYLSPPFDINGLCAFSISEKYMLRIEHKKSSWLDLFWENCYIDINFSEYDGDTVVIDSSNFFKN